jgi:hypothetical protein
MPLLRSRAHFTLALAGWFTVAALTWHLLTPAYDRLLVGVGNTVSGLLGPPRITRLTSHDDTIVIWHRLADTPAEVPVALSGTQFHFNLVVLAALCLASSWVGWAKRFGLLALAVPLLLATHFLTLRLDAYYQLVTHGLLAYPPRISFFFTSWVIVAFKGMGPLLFPALIWAVLFRPPPLEAVLRRSEVPPPVRVARSSRPAARARRSSQGGG